MKYLLLLIALVATPAAAGQLVSVDVTLDLPNVHALLGADGITLGAHTAVLVTHDGPVHCELLTGSLTQERGRVRRTDFLGSTVRTWRQRTWRVLCDAGAGLLTVSRETLATHRKDVQP